MRMAALFGIDPAQVACWTGPMMHHALQSTAGQRPLNEWLPVAIADLLSVLIATAGGKTTRAEVLESWGWTDLQPRMTDEQLIGWASNV
jgi:hypothetical protein